jgi:hypothetical protein
MPLPARQLGRAVRYNSVKARKIGWLAKYQQVTGVVGVGSKEPTAELFAQAVADWQSKNPPLSTDGMLGPSSWRTMQRQLQNGFSTASPPPP